MVSYNVKGREVRNEKINDIGNIEVPLDTPVILSAILNINIKELDWDASFADENNIMFQILKGSGLDSNFHIASSAIRFSKFDTIWLGLEPNESRHWKCLV